MLGAGKDDHVRDLWWWVERSTMPGCIRSQTCPDVTKADPAHSAASLTTLTGNILFSMPISQSRPKIRDL